MRGTLRDLGVGAGLFSFGESSILAVGSHPLGTGWRVSVQHPEAGERLAGYRLRDQALSTSSTLYNGARKGAVNEHIIDPSTGQNVRQTRFAMVQAKSAALAEAFSTAAIVHKPTEGMMRYPRIISLDVFKMSLAKVTSGGGSYA